MLHAIGRRIRVAVDPPQTPNWELLLHPCVDRWHATHTPSNSSTSRQLPTLLPILMLLSTHIQSSRIAKTSSPSLLTLSLETSHSRPSWIGAPPFATSFHKLSPSQKRPIVSAGQTAHLHLPAEESYTAAWSSFGRVARATRDSIGINSLYIT